MAPNKNYTSFVANTSRGVTYFYVNESTRALNTRVQPPVQPNLLNFQLPWNISCNNQSYFGGWPKKDCPWWSGQSGASLVVDNGTRVLQTVVVAWLGGDEGSTLENQGVHVFTSPATDTYVCRAPCICGMLCVGLPASITCAIVYSIYVICLIVYQIC